MLSARAARGRAAALTLAVSVLVAAPAAAQSAAPRSGGGVELDSLRLYYLGYPIGRERFSIARDTAGIRLTADFDYTDRGRRTHLTGEVQLSGDWSPRQLVVARLTDTSRVVETAVKVSGDSATVERVAGRTRIAWPSSAFAISPYAPVSQHLALVRYWRAHGRPATLAVAPGAPTNLVRIALSGRDTILIAARRVVLDRYAIDGVVWGREYLWTDASGRLAAFTTAGGGGLSLEAIRYDLEPAYDALMRRAARAAIADLERLSRRIAVDRSSRTAIVGATLIDGRGGEPVHNATVVVDAGRIVAVGAGVPVPRGAHVIDGRGKTVMPGLWDMHTHLNQIEWATVYLAAGVTTVRDMGSEIPFITALRKSVHEGRSAGPTMLLAGLIDGGGPNAFGAINATTADEGRRAVDRYHALGFEQMKLYSLLAPDVVAAISRRAHELGMTVTGHVPVALSLLTAVDSGMDHIAHLPLRGDPASDSVQQTIAALKRHGTVIDPTASWGELLGHSRQLAVAEFQPVIGHLPPVLAQRIVGMGTAGIDAATGKARLDRTLAMLRELDRAGVPIVVGTDEGIPAFSVYREIELYVQAGISPMHALLDATAVPARAMGLERSVGTIAPGMRADLIVLDANPLDDIANIRSVRWVMRGGRVYESAAVWRAAGFTP